VTALEPSSSPLSSPPTVEPTAVPSVAPGPVKPIADGGGAFAVVGRAMFGIAGAYLLRAAAESELVPKPIVATVAIASAVPTVIRVHTVLIFMTVFPVVFLIVRNQVVEREAVVAIDIVDGLEGMIGML